MSIKNKKVTIENSAGNIVHPEDIGTFQDGIWSFSTFSGAAGSCSAVGTGDEHGAAGVALYWSIPVSDLTAAFIGGAVCELLPVPGSSVILKLVASGTCAGIGALIKQKFFNTTNSVAVVDDDRACQPYVGCFPMVGVDFDDGYTTSPNEFSATGGFGPFHVVD